MEKIKTFEVLNTALIKHYLCFKSERFWLRDFEIHNKFVSIDTSIKDNCPKNLCRFIAKYIKRISVADTFDYIYVGAWHFKVSKL